jgi:O-acetyl-ADP-ribose deacetylase (regulator of RNase III)
MVGIRSDLSTVSKENPVIREVEGDILLSQAQLIAHGIATQDPFDSGLARCAALPSMVRDYRHAMHSNHPRPADLGLARRRRGRQHPRHRRLLTGHAKPGQVGAA